jgi:hypothetical protein
MMNLANTSVNYLRYSQEHAKNTNAQALNRISKGQESFRPDQVGYSPLLSQIITQNRNKSNTSNPCIAEKMLFGPHLRETYAHHVHKRYVEESESDAGSVIAKIDGDSH